MEFLFDEIPSHAQHDIIGTIVFVIFLLAVDISLRFIIELVNYNRHMKKSLTLWNMITALWFGWSIVILPDGTKKRFLASKNFRMSLTVKAGVQYPLMFTLSAAAFMLTDYEMFGYQADAFISHVFMLIPVLCELTSIVEKLNELHDESFDWVHKFLSFIKEVKR